MVEKVIARGWGLKQASIFAILLALAVVVSQVATSGNLGEALIKREDSPRSAEKPAPPGLREASGGVGERTSFPPSGSLARDDAVVDVREFTIRVQDEFDRRVPDFEASLEIAGEQTITVLAGSSGVANLVILESSAKSRTYLNVVSQGYVPVSVLLPNGLDDADEEIVVTLRASTHVRVLVVDQGGIPVDTGSVSLRPETGLDTGVKVSGIDGGSAFLVLGTDSEIGNDGVAEFTELLPGPYWLTDGREGAWWNLGGEAVDLEIGTNQLTWEVERWARTEYCSGEIVWEDGPQDWQWHVGFGRSGSGSQQHFAEGHGDGARFFVHFGDEDGPESFDFFHQNTSSVAKGVELAPGVHGVVVTLNIVDPSGG